MPTQPEHRRDRAELIDDLVDALRLFTVESDVFVDGFARAHGLGRNDLNAIMWISTGTGTGRPVTAGELASRLNLGAPATTALVDRLENAGHVRRVRDPHDRRRVGIEMQPRALQLAVAFFRPLGRLLSDAVADVADEDLASTAAVVRRMAAAVVAARGNGPNPPRGRAVAAALPPRRTTPARRTTPDAPDHG